MNEGASNIIVQGFLKGGYDVFDALLSLSFSYNSTDVSDLAPDALAGLLTTHPVAMYSKFKGGGGVAMLYTTEDVSKLISFMDTGEATAKESLEEADVQVFREIADSVLGGGVANLSEKFGEDVELDGVEVGADGADRENALREILGDAAIVANYKFTAEPHFDGSAVLVFSQVLEDRVPASLLGGGESSDEPLVSDEEIQNILGSFGPEDHADAAMSASKQSMPGNLGVILDIELTAIARLGRVEMPIAEILDFGPGSIIEVGHLVDEPVELLVNNKLIARGDVVVVDEKFGLRITEIISQEERIESLR